MSIHDFYDESPTKRKTRENILDVAAELFIQKGIELVNMKDVAAAGGLTPRNLSRYYPGKEYLVVDVAYHLFNRYSEAHGYVVDDMMTGWEQLRSYMNQVVDGDMSDTTGTGLIVFVMYFDLYLSKMDVDHEAYKRYTEIYVPEINEPEYQILGGILLRGIEDETIEGDVSEVDYLCDYIQQSLVSIAARVVIKEKENKRINRSLLNRHKQMILDNLSKEKRR